MIDKIAKLILSCPGATNQVLCLAYVMNLIVKIILCQFDAHCLPKKHKKGKKTKAKGNSNSEINEEALKSESGKEAIDNVASSESAGEDEDVLDLGELADTIEQKEKEMDEGILESKGEGVELGEDKWDQFEGTLWKNVKEVAVKVQPACIVLTKVS
ncbi:hypothetical protein H1R20_g8969, partial [Candolleomyces eurysporus]